MRFVGANESPPSQRPVFDEFDYAIREQKQDSDNEHVRDDDLHAQEVRGVPEVLADTGHPEELGGDHDHPRLAGSRPKAGEQLGRRGGEDDLPNEPEIRIGAERSGDLDQLGIDARNAALEAALAHGDLARDAVMLLDDDDVLLDPEHLAAAIARLARGEAIVHRGGWFEFETDGRREPFDPPTTAASLREDNTILTVGLAWPAALHARLGRFDPAMGSYFDWDWILRVLDAGVPLAHLDGLGVGYRVHDANTSARKAGARSDAFARFIAKHALDVVQKDHVAVHRERRGEGA